jgi:hypothetical protein
VLLATDEDLPVDSGTDYAADWVGKDRPLIAAWHGDDGGAVLLTGGSLLAGPLKTNGGQYSELRENERLAKNILSFVLRGSKVREEQTPNQLLERAERNLADSVLNTLKKRPGGDWWYEGIPESVRRSAMDRHEVEKGRFPKEAYLYLLDLGAIIKFNFSIFEPMLEQVGWTGGKARSMGWLTKLNEHRRLAAHPLKAHLSDHEFTAEDVDFIKETERRISKLADSGGGT